MDNQNNNDSLKPPPATPLTPPSPADLAPPKDMQSQDAPANIAPNNVEPEKNSEAAGEQPLPVSEPPVPIATPPTETPEKAPFVSVDQSGAPPGGRHKRNTIIYVAVGIISFALMALAIYFAYGNFTAQTTPDENQEAQAVPEISPLVIGTDATYPPMEFLSANGALTGYDIELGNKISEKQGRKAEFRNIAWDDLFTALENGEVDIIISGVTITTERQSLYDFSNPYINAGQVLITKSEETGIITTNDLNGKKIAVQTDTTNHEEALKYAPSDMVLTYEDFLGATEALLSGEADVIISDLTNAKGIIAGNETLKIVGDPITDDYYGIVIKKGNTELLNSINGALAELDRQGTLEFLKQKWLE